MTAIEAALNDLKLHRQTIRALVEELHSEARQQPGLIQQSAQRTFPILAQLNETVDLTQVQITPHRHGQPHLVPEPMPLKWLEAATMLRGVAPTDDPNLEAAWTHSIDQAFWWAAPTAWADEQDKISHLIDGLKKLQGEISTALKTISQFHADQQAAASGSDLAFSELLGPTTRRPQPTDDTWGQYIRPLLVGFVIATFTILAIVSIVRQVDHRAQLGQGPNPLAEAIDRKLLHFEQRQLMRLALIRQWDKELWDAVKDNPDPDVLRSFLTQHPSNPATDLAKVRILKLEKPLLLALLEDAGFTPRDLRDLALEALPESVNSFYRPRR